MSAPTAIHKLAVYDGRELLGSVHVTDDGTHQAMSVDGEVIGTFRKREEASRAFSASKKNSRVNASDE